MPNFSINFADIQEQSAVAPGVYSIVVDDVIMKQSADGSSHYLNWNLKITTPGDFVDRHVFLMTSLKPSVLWRLKAVLRAFQLEPENVAFEVDDESGTVLQPDFRGLVAVVKVTNETYQNVVRDRVEDIYPMTDDALNNVVTAPARAPGSPNSIGAKPAKPATQAPKKVLR